MDPAHDMMRASRRPRVLATMVLFMLGAAFAACVGEDPPFGAGDGRDASGSSSGAAGAVPSTSSGGGQSTSSGATSTSGAPSGSGSGEDASISSSDASDGSSGDIDASEQLTDASEAGADASEAGADAADASDGASPGNDASVTCGAGTKPCGTTCVLTDPAHGCATAGRCTACAASESCVGAPSSCQCVTEPTATTCSRVQCGVTQDNCNVAVDCGSSPCVAGAPTCANATTRRSYAAACNGNTCTSTPTDTACPANQECGGAGVCNVCASDTACGAACSACGPPTPHCKALGATSTCVECTDNTQCISGSCDTATNTCTYCKPTSIVESEPNGTTGTADPLPNATSSYCGTIATIGENDYASFTLPAGATSINLSYAWQPGANLVVDGTADGVAFGFPGLVPFKPGKLYVLHVTSTNGTPQYRLDITINP